MRKILIVVLSLFSATSYAAGIYKWVDENGVTHYGERKPSNAQSEQMNIKKKSDSAPAPKQLTGGAKDLADSFAKEIMRDKGDAAEVNCKKAVNNAKGSIDTMLSVGKKNYKDGYIKDAEYRKMSTKLKQIKSKISISECQRSKGKTQGFYKCMSNGANHVASCGKKYNYGS